ncbi:hypothetical protein FXW07_13000 [Methanosarcina sp. DH1]|uniref:hypothetical protein n=1 Tax=Methanosarcina sp. DH1 TaxID=2605695 RepID=UPI001E55A22B|nr:hypothetical protein [Methanosarcina sp. DH1]MCC4767502.1 hypothetical protein [Methanosarcina sp. DH1]
MNLLWNYSADLLSVNADLTSVNADFTSVNADLMSVNADLTPVNNVTENRLQKQFKNYWKTSLETYVRNSWISVISVTTT